MILHRVMAEPHLAAELNHTPETVLRSTHLAILQRVNRSLFCLTVAAQDGYIEKDRYRLKTPGARD